MGVRVFRVVTHFPIGEQRRHGLTPRVEFEAYAYNPFRLGWASTPQKAVVASRKGHDRRRHR